MRYCRDCSYYYGRSKKKIVYYCMLRREHVSPHQRACKEFSPRRGGMGGGLRGLIKALGAT